jgi:hypothetical protein
LQLDALKKAGREKIFKDEGRATLDLR